VRRGVTLIELTLVLLVLGLGVALVGPALLREQERSPQFVDVVRGAREVAIARAQSLVLTVDPAGSWQLHTTSDRTAVGRGVVGDPPASGVSLALMPTGACLVRTPASDRWDAARCTTRGGRP
jgi:prepilin-type N-terminal cleavage/methylation domain-containing protein